MNHKYKVGDEVEIEGNKTKIRSVLDNIDGGYTVEPPVFGIRYWNEDSMKAAA